MEGVSLSPGVTRMVGLTASMVSFEESSELVRELAGVDVGAKRVERVAEAVGREIAQDEQTVVEPSPPVAPTMCTWAWMAPAFRCGLRSWRDVRASKPTARPRRARSNWSWSGPRKGAIRRAFLCATRVR